MSILSLLINSFDHARLFPKKYKFKQHTESYNLPKILFTVHSILCTTPVVMKRNSLNAVK